MSEEHLIGKQFILDAKYNNASIITLISKGRHFCMVRDQDGNEWETMFNRLTPIKS